MKTETPIERPFFAQFLESQQRGNEESLRQATESWGTNKFLDWPAHTDKYPSDGDDGVE